MQVIFKLSEEWQTRKRQKKYNYRRAKENFITLMIGLISRIFDYDETIKSMLNRKKQASMLLQQGESRGQREIKKEKICLILSGQISDWSCLRVLESQGKSPPSSVKGQGKIDHYVDIFHGREQFTSKSIKKKAICRIIQRKYMSSGQKI